MGTSSSIDIACISSKPKDPNRLDELLERCMGVGSSAFPELVEELLLETLFFECLAEVLEEAVVCLDGSLSISLGLVLRFVLSFCLFWLFWVPGAVALSQPFATATESAGPR